MIRPTEHPTGYGRFWRLAAGGLLAAIVVTLSIIVISTFFGLPTNAGVAGALGAAAGAMWVASARR